MTSRIARLRRAAVTALATVIAVACGAAPASAAPVYAGDKIEIHYSNGARALCSLNSVAHRDGAQYGITAGHCLMPINGGRPIRVYSSDGAVIASNMADSGHVFDQGGLSIGLDGFHSESFRDYSWFRLDPHVTYAGKTRGGNVTVGLDAGMDHNLTQLARSIHPDRAIGGRLPVSAVKPGQIVCKDGARSSRTCGPVVSTNVHSGEIVALLLNFTGDSGAPVWITGRDGRVYIVGVVSGGVGPFELIDASLPLPAGLR